MGRYMRQVKIEFRYGAANGGLPIMNARERKETGPAIWTLIELLFSRGGVACLDGDWNWAVWADGSVSSVKELASSMAEQIGWAGSTKGLWFPKR